MPFAIRISTLYIGQGLCNVIEVHKGIAAFSLPDIEDGHPTFAEGGKHGQATLEFLAIVDMGTIDAQIGGSAFQCSAAVKFVELLLRKKRNPGVIDYVYISHTDADHFNGFQELTEPFKTNPLFPGKNYYLSINNLVVGGTLRPNIAGYDPQMAMWLETFIGEYHYEVPNPLSYSSAYYFPLSNPYATAPMPDSSSSIHFEFDLGDNHVMRANVLVQRGPFSAGFPKTERVTSRDIFVNAGSVILLVSVVDIRDNSIKISALMPGDATWETFSWFLNKPVIGAPYLFGNERKYFVVPHHGSLNTSTPDLGGEIIDFTVFSNFMGRYMPTFAIASAHDMYSHPNKSVMRVVQDKLAVGKGTPHIVRWHTESKYENAVTDRRVYTTYYEDSDALLYNKLRCNLHITYHSLHSLQETSYIFYTIPFPYTS